MSNLREKALLFTPFREKTVTVVAALPDGGAVDLTFLVRQPSVGQRSRIAAEAKGDLEGMGAAAALTAAILECVLDPETRKPVFEKSDVDRLLELPAGGWFDDLSKAVMELMTEGEKAAKK